MLKKLIFSFGLLFLMFNTTQANEQTDAIELCTSAYKNSIFSAYSDQCIHNDRSLKFWQCTESRMSNNKELIMFAINQCEKL